MRTVVVELCTARCIEQGQIRSIYQGDYTGHLGNGAHNRFGQAGFPEEVARGGSECAHTASTGDGINGGDTAGYEESRPIPYCRRDTALPTLRTRPGSGNLLGPDGDATERGPVGSVIDAVPVTRPPTL